MQSHFIIGRIALSGALLLADGAAIAADKNNFAAPTKSDNIAAICVRDASGYHLDAGRLANWYFIKYPDVAQAFQSADQLRAALAQDPSAINPANRGGNDPNQPMVSAILGGMSYLPAGGLFTFGKVNGQDFNRFLIFRAELDGGADRAVDRRHWVSKLVPEHRYEFAMPAFAFLAGIAGIHGGQRGTGRDRQVREQAHVFEIELACRGVRHHPYRADEAIVSRNRHDESFGNLHAGKLQAGKAILRAKK